MSCLSLILTKLAVWFSIWLGLGHVYGELCSLTLSARFLYCPAVHFTHFLHQVQSVATVLSMTFLEDLVFFSLWYANAVILVDELQVIFAGLIVHSDLAYLFTVLQRVVNQVVEELPQKRISEQG